MNLFLRDGVDAASATVYNEYHLILNAGLNPEELTTFPFSEQGLNFPEDGLYCLEKTFEKNPERACRLSGPPWRAGSMPLTIRRRPWTSS